MHRVFPFLERSQNGIFFLKHFYVLFTLIDIQRRVKAQVTNGICANHRIKINSLEQNEYNTVCSTTKLNNLF